MTYEARALVPMERDAILDAVERIRELAHVEFLITFENVSLEERQSLRDDLNMELQALGGSPLTPAQQVRS